MNITDPIADLFTRIRNAILVKHEDMIVPYSKMKLSIVEILKNEGYVKNIEVFKKDLNKRFIRVHLKYTEEGDSAISTIRRVSKPGKRIYLKKANIPKVLNGFGVGFYTTSRGIKTAREARVENLGGEYIGEVW